MKLIRLLPVFILSLSLASPLIGFAQSLDELADNSQAVTEEEEDALSAYMQGKKPVTQDNMDKAAIVASPIVNACGTLAGGIIMVTSAAVFVITAIDLAYIGIPPLRSKLNPQYGTGAGQAGAVQPQPSICWVSDEAKQCIVPNNMVTPGMQGIQPQQPMKSVIFTYFKKRSFFIILFTICTVVLMSSVFTDCGLNLAALLSKIVSEFSSQVSSVNI